MACRLPSDTHAAAPPVAVAASRLCAVLVHATDRRLPRVLLAYLALLIRERKDSSMWFARSLARSSFTRSPRPLSCLVYIQWVPELQHHCPGTTYILVGTKLDLRSDEATIDNLKKQGLAPISTEMGQAMAKEIGAHDFIEVPSSGFSSLLYSAAAATVVVVWWLCVRLVINYALHVARSARLSHSKASSTYSTRPLASSSRSSLTKTTLRLRPPSHRGATAVLYSNNSSHTTVRPFARQFARQSVSPPLCELHSALTR